jgi:hypothetical protein
MVDRTWVGAVLGLILFCIGGIGYAYMDYSVHRERMFYDFRRGNPIGAYKERMRSQGTPSWPVYLAVCIPLGIVVVFSSIIFGNRSR